MHSVASDPVDPAAQELVKIDVFGTA